MQNAECKMQNKVTFRQSEKYLIMIFSFWQNENSSKLDYAIVPIIFERCKKIFLNFAFCILPFAFKFRPA